MVLVIIMDEQIMRSFRQQVEFMAEDMQKPQKCAARLRNGTCKINATCGRFCKKHHHLENNIKYMVRPGADCNVVYHNHPPLVLCGQGCPRFDAIVCT
jgi:cupin superfamily acireductone dioxygenase involved in methionine salvage